MYKQFYWQHIPKAVLTKVGVADKQAFAEEWMTGIIRLFHGMTAAEFADVCEWVVEHELWPKRREDIIAALKVHQAAGERTILVSGTYQPVLESFARRLQADALGTPLEFVAERLTGCVLGSLNTESVKAERLHEHLGYERLYAAYGNTEADIPMLMLSDKPVAVYPDKTLRGTAKSLGWTVFEH